MKRNKRALQIFIGLLFALIQVMSMLSCAPAVRKGPNISGEWTGYYEYDDPQRSSERGYFTINFHQDGSKILGTVSEPRTTFGPENAGVLWSDISGTFNAMNKEIRFTKTYRYDGHAVEYYGKLDPSGDSVSGGVWSIRDYKGTWTINRSR
jgi:hypothetical protein